VAEIRHHGAERVLDIGCGSGRIGELVLDAGAREYVGVDFSETMVDLARDRLRRFGARVRLLQSDFLDAPIEGSFGLVIAFGFFDYVSEPNPFIRRMCERCTGSVLASFPSWDWLKGPIRKLRYEVLNDCPIFDYSETEAEQMFAACGFGRVEVLTRGRSDFVMRAVGGVERLEGLACR
jgi:SAM-dependent methyltransferase